MSEPNCRLDDDQNSFQSTHRPSLEPCSATHQLLVLQQTCSAAACGEFCKQATIKDRRQQQPHDLGN